MRSILEFAESKCNGRINFIFSNDDAFREISTDWTPDIIAYHLAQLHDAGFIRGKRDTIIDLTFSGHQLIEAMRSDTLWNKIKSGMKAFGIEGLKQVPALAIQILSQGK